MGKVKQDLGSNAVILQTRQFKEGGFFGFFSKSKVEITAAIEVEHVQKTEAPPTRVSRPVYQEAYAPMPVRFEPRKEKTAETDSLEMEIYSIREMLVKMNYKIEGLDKEQSVWPESLQKWADHLEEQGINSKIVKKHLRQVQKLVPEDDWTNERQVLECLKKSIRMACNNTDLITPGKGKPSVVALIGPTGVGKTTTIGKLAASFGIIDKRRVALITVDTYRVAAVEQLKTFGEIIGVPVEVVNTPSELEKVIHIHQDKEMIFIDTAGRSPHHEIHMSELKAFLEKANPDYKMLVMSANMATKDQLKTYERFKTLTTHFIFTKLDETVNKGALLNLIEEVDLPITYITNGQSVPDDIEKATPENLTRYILGEVKIHE